MLAKKQLGTARALSAMLLVSGQAAHIRRSANADAKGEQCLMAKFANYADVGWVEKRR